MRPLVLATSPEARHDVTKASRCKGWVIVDGWMLPWPEWDVATARVVCTGVVSVGAEARACVLAAARGAGVVAEVDVHADVTAQLYDELARLAPVTVRHAVRKVAGALAPEERRLLALLAAGATLGEAGNELFISRRTADRRLAAARRALGVQSTAEALLALRRGK